MSQENIETSSDTQSKGKSILTALAQHEVTLLLDVFLANLPPSTLEAILDRLPADTRQTLQHIINPIALPEVNAEKPTSVAKLAQTWSNLWKQWNDIVFEATDEEGKYIEQEAEWEPPYFSYSALVEDLEAIAKEMQLLLPRAYEHKLEPNVDFAQALSELAQEISNELPDWIELVEEEFYLENCLTDCLLQWRWLQAKERVIDALVFLQEIREWEEETKQVNLKPSAFLDFFTKLQDADLQKIYEGLTSHEQELLWKTYLENIHSHWHELYLYCLKKYAPDRHLEILRATISQHWQNGLPVIEDLLAKEAYQESLAVLEETLTSLLSPHREVNWTPESSLFVTILGGFRGSELSGKEQTLLRYYQQAATALNRAERIEALQLQLNAIENIFNWSAMLESFKNTKISEATRYNLFQSWRNYILRVTEKQRKAESSWWLGWLLDSISPLPQATEQFQHQIKQWLLATNSDKELSHQNFLALRLLTHDLAEIRGENWYRYPNFLAVTIVPGNLKTPDAQFRQSFLKQLAPTDLWDKVMAYWQNHLDQWIPQPETARKSDYTEQAKWMSALREISPTAFDNLLAKWRIQHKQRRNLWKALEQFGLI
ncbi:MAG TPA: hypothetical protein V6D12_04570 [Candidatus Obscuribacterales bacterium]